MEKVLACSIVAALLKATFVAADHESGHLQSFDFRFSSTKLLKPISDHTATLFEGIVYLAGGCDAANGNVYNADIGGFTCDSISDQLYSFDYQTNAIVQLATMPRARYRHAAVAVNGKLWLVGGRRADDDTIIGQVDVYDMQADTWDSFDLPEEYYTSDLTGFNHESYAFFAGGYDSTYETFSDTVFAIDTEASMATLGGSGNATLVIEKKAPLLIGRGDVSSVTDDKSSYALVTGGFGANQGFCEPEDAVDLYHFINDTWTSVSPIPHGRSDTALVELNGFVFAFGGERQIKGICDRDDNNKPEPGEMTVAVDDVVMFDWNQNNRNWTYLSDLPQTRFRFAAAAIDDANAVYAFGGQTEYEEECQCFKTTDEIMVYNEVDVKDDSDNTGGSTDNSAGLMAGVCAVLVCISSFSFFL